MTPTPSRLGRPHPGGARLGPEADLEAVVRSAEARAYPRPLAGADPSGARAARRARVPYLIAAHGMAEPWAMRHKLEEELYSALVEGKNLRRAACLHALSRPEVGHLGDRAPDARLLRPQRRRPRAFDDLPDRDLLEPSTPSLRANSSSSSSAGST